jgi:lipoprotein NlpD
MTTAKTGHSMSREQVHGEAGMRPAANVAGIWLAAVMLLAGCATSQQAPVIERTPQSRKVAPAAKPAAEPEKKSAPAEKDWRPDSYTVKKGDTLYGIGLELGYDYKEIAQKNNLSPPYVIRIGQTLKLKDPRAAESTPTEIVPGTGAVTSPLKSEQAATSRPIGEPPLKTEPKATKEPYSEQAMAAPPPKPVETAAVKTEASRPAEPSSSEPPADKPSTALPVASAASDDEALDWAWPAQGKVLAGFSESAGSKGLDIAGTQGQPVLAAAAGKVVYSGAGLRGYGKLVIIKHNKTYLSAYAHNSQILVKEGQEVAKGQKIAEMGSTDTERVKLHFEIRKLGKPVDPSKHLPDKP